MLQPEASSPKKPRKKSAAPQAAVTETDSAAPPQFAEPGSPASIPEDRDFTPPGEALEDLLSHAEKVLSAEPKGEDEDGNGGYNEPDPDDFSRDKGEKDPIADLISMQQESQVENQITGLLLAIEGICEQHALVAIANGHKSIAGDLNTLRGAGRHLSRRINVHRYWTRVPF